MGFLRFLQVSLFRPAARPVARRPRVLMSDPQLTGIWTALQKEYFPDRTDILEYTIGWSTRRQRRTLGSCNFIRRRVKVAKEMRDPRAEKWLAPLLYHEMCHAILGEEVGRCGTKRAWHGPAFKKLEARHPEIEAMNEWIKTGGWLSAVRSDRARSKHRMR